MILFVPLIYLFNLLVVRSSALSIPQIRNDETPKLITFSQTERFIIPARFASSAYCTNLTEGSNLDEDATILYYAGNGRQIQRVYVAHSPTQGVIVAFQGTNTSSIRSIENDIEFDQVKVNSRLSFLGKDVQISYGFQDQWLQTADEILRETQKALQRFPGSNLMVVGHSLGAALALLSAAHLSQNVHVSLSTILFGLPRVGNDEFANAIDKFLPNQNHIVNFRDPVPHLPPRTFGFQHSSGQIWIKKYGSTNALQCPGQENEHCSDEVHFYDYDVDDHFGPYFGVEMGCD